MNIPTHLQHLQNVSSRPDGSVSFLDTKLNNSRFGADATTVLSPLEARATFDRKYRLENFDEALEDQYKSNRGTPTSFVDDLTTRAARGIKGAFNGASANPGRARTTSSILAAMAGGGAAAALSGEHKIRNGILAALAAGAVGYAATGQRKQASDSREYVLRAIESAQDINRENKGLVLNKINELSEDRADQLAMTLRAGYGAGVGYLIAKFFGIGWLMPTAIGGLVGLSMTGNKNRRNAMGRIML